jgi:hypothetical protein
LLSSARRLLGTVSAGCAISAAVLLVPTVSAAQGALINRGPCNSNALSQPFAPWGDSSSYELAPGGDFESSDFASSPWTLTGGAQLVAGSEPYAATGTLGASSLSVPAGATALSPTTCVDAAYPTLRFFVGGSGSVALSIVYDGVSIPTGVVVAAGSWTPTPVMITTDSLLGLLSGGTAQVSLELTGLTGSPQVDDVFIDPWGRD